MTPLLSHPLSVRARLHVGIALCVLLFALLLALAPATWGAPAGAGQYPAGASRPAIPARSGQFAHSAKAPSPHGNPARALLAFKTMQKNYYLQGTGLYRGEPYSFLWPFSQAMAATVSLVYIPGESKGFAHELRVRMYGLERYLQKPSARSASPSASSASEAPESPEASEPAAPGPSSAAPALPSFAGSVAPPIGPGGVSYYDDNEWVGIELARIYEFNHEAFALEQAKQIMAFVMSAWKTTGPNGKPLPCPGGVPFSNSSSNNTRNTVTDGPGAELAVQLYRITGEAQYLQFAESAYAWVRQCLLNSEGLYADHIQNNGEVEPMVWSYNQGSMMGAGALLYQVTGNGAYLYEARQTARAALAHFTLEKLELENPFFVVVYYRNLLYLDSITHDPPGTRAVQEYVNYAWQNLRLSNNLFVSGSPSTSTLLGQAAMVQLYALLCIPAKNYF